jgi:putative ABC transport system substrate-binding protein
MRRRDFISALIGTGIWPGMAAAQRSSARLPRVAYLGPSSPDILDPRQIRQFKDGLVENDLIAGENVTVEYYWAEGSLDRLRDLATKLGRQNFDVIVTVGEQSFRFLKAAQTRSPIVLAVIGDIVADGIVDSLARPSGNVTGLSMSNKDLEGKRIEILKEAVPAVTQLMILHDPSSAPSKLAEAQTAATRLSIETLVFETADPAAFDGAFTKAAKAGANGLAVTASSILNRHREPLIELARRHRLPSIWEASIYVRDGGLISYGPSFADMYRRSAGYVAKIIKGARPEELPIQLPTKFEMAINLRTAKDLGLEVPATMLARADEVIE